MRGIQIRKGGHSCGENPAVGRDLKRSSEQVHSRLTEVSKARKETTWVCEGGISGRGNEKGRPQ